MGQVAVDLSDPPSQQPSTEDAVAAAAHADDLLAQLAGEEIDRLLAEADAGRGDAAEAPAPATPVMTEPEPAAPSAIDEKPFVEIGKVFDDASAPRTKAPASVATPPPTSPPAVQAVEDATVAGEREALSAEPADPVVLSLLLKPLEWINAPLAACPQSVRELIGKAAIITLVNAVAVLIYVVMFRWK